LPGAVISASPAEGSFRHILLKNSVFQSDVLEIENFWRIRQSEIIFGAAKTSKNDTVRAVVMVKISLNLWAKSFSTEYTRSGRLNQNTITVAEAVYW
jgi:hypothetical protein